MPVLDVIRAQIAASKNDLDQYRPTEMDWSARSLAAVDQFIPWLVGLAPRLRDYVQEVLSAPTLIRRMWSSVKSRVNLPVAQLEEFERLLALDDILRESVTGETVSAVVTRYLLDHAAPLTLDKNGRSDYPDVFRSTPGLYDQLPTFARKTKAKDGDTDEYGAAVKGKSKRPVRVPDGLEIKTCRGRVAVDCHYPHAGLHLVVLFTETARVYTVTDLLVAFLHRSHYRESERNTDATTVKYSFNGDHFVSLLTNGIPSPRPAKKRR